jgi:hypothetical protein
MLALDLSSGLCLPIAGITDVSHLTWLFFILDKLNLSAAKGPPTNPSCLSTVMCVGLDANTCLQENYNLLLLSSGIHFWVAREAVVPQRTAGPLLGLTPACTEVRVWKFLLLLYLSWGNALLPCPTLVPVQSAHRA